MLEADPSVLDGLLPLLYRSLIGQQLQGSTFLTLQQEREDGVAQLGCVPSAPCNTLTGEVPL
jgi:hypothetical protein